ncbi:MAG TPA: hypothetical protein VE844_09320 [Gammaproteobacteria bacterium]|nr:hypothetical protein [Gammaproteobacteria bacterium]
MKAGSHSMPAVHCEASATLHLVQIEVSPAHPLLGLKRALPWEVITDVMTRQWRQNGKNVDGGRGLPWDVSLYVPLVVLMLIKGFDSRQMEAYVAENVVARVFIGRQREVKAQIRDHSNIARAYAALGKAGIDEVNRLVVQEAHRFGFVDEGSLSADTTAQELPIGYPNEPGILRGLAQRCGRALTQLQKRGVQRLGGALRQVQTILRSVKEHHLFTSGKADKRQVLSRIMREVGDLMVQTRPLVERLATRSERVIQRARSRLMAMHEVIKPLIGQIVHWLTTGKVAANKIIPVGIPQARAIVHNKAGKKTEFGLAYLLSRLGGGYLFGERITANADERQMPLKALARYRAIFGQEATPEFMVYDRGGDSTATRQRLASEGVKDVGIQPKGKRPWSVAEAVREQIRSEGGRTEGCIGTLTSNRYRFNKPKERLWQTLEMAGPRSILSFNLNKLMRDVVALVQ